MERASEEDNDVVITPAVWRRHISARVSHFLCRCVAAVMGHFGLGRRGGGTAFFEGVLLCGAPNEQITTALRYNRDRRYRCPLSRSPLSRRG